MHSFRLPVRGLAASAAAIALVFAAGASQAAMTTTTSQSAFITAVGGTTDSFSNLTINSALGTGTLTRTAGAFTYTATTQTEFYVVPAAGTIALSTGSFSDTIGFGAFTTPVLSFGGNFFATNVLGELTGGVLTVAATDINGLVVSRTVPGGSLAGFLGFQSDTPLASVVVSIAASGQSATFDPTNAYASVDNVVLSAVPEASTWMMMLAGGAMVLRLGARRRG